MKKFLDKLTDNIMVISNEGKIVFVNKACVRSLGYEEINLSDINERVKIKDNKINIQYDKELLKNGLCEFSSIPWYGDTAKSVLIKWDNEIRDKAKIEIYEKFLDQMEPTIYVRDINNELIYINKSCADYYHNNRMKAMEIMKKEIQFGRASKYVVKEDDYVIKHKKKCFYEMESDKHDITEYYEVKKYPLFDDNGEVKYIGMVVKDISLQKNIQYKILNNLNLIEGIDETGKLKMNRVDETIFDNFKAIFGKFLNAKFFNIWIYDKYNQEIKPALPMYLLTKENIEKKIFPMTKVDISKYLNGTYEKVIKVKDKDLNLKAENKTFYVAKYPLMIQGEFKGIMTMSHDEYPKEEANGNNLIKTLCAEMAFIIHYMELSKRIHEELKYRNEVESELESFLKVSTDIVLKVDKTVVKEVNDSCISVLGWTREQFLKLKSEELIHPEDLAMTLKLMQKQAETEERLVWENRLKCSDGTYKWFRWSNINYRESRGYVYSAGKDITLEKELELKEKQIEKAKQLEEVKNEFFANISHEFKTPINLIMATSQLMLKQIQGNEIEYKTMGEIKKHIKIFRQNGYRLLRLVNNLIDITKIDSGFYKINPVNINIISVIEDIVLSVVEYCKGNKIELVFDTEVEEEIIACDPDQIERIILNLLSNAIKYTAENGEIRVNINIEEEYVEVQVKDTGTGIPKDKLEVIFERFVQGEDTLSRTCEGSGIGLSLVKGLAEMHGGNVRVLSEEGIGSTFEVRLPRKQVKQIETIYVTQEIKQSNIEKCTIEFADIYNMHM